MNGYVQRLFETYLPGILVGDGVAVPDDEEEMNWRIFFAHTQDMQGFQADVFTGGPNERKHATDSLFKPLRPRWEETGGDSRSLIADLASLWEREDAQSGLIRLTRQTQTSIGPALDLLTGSGVAGAVVFAETLKAFKGRKTNRMIRAYIQNAGVLAQHGCSYRSYLQSVLRGEALPPVDVLAAEQRWVEHIDGFYNVGPALANYMICDWLLWLWREGCIEWFESYKEDGVHQEAARKGLVPEWRHNFVECCKSVRIPEGFGTVSGKRCPPRVLNECIFLDGTTSWTVCRSAGAYRIRCNSL